jgi:hypothetical protein
MFSQFNYHVKLSSGDHDQEVIKRLELWGNNFWHIGRDHCRERRKVLGSRTTTLSSLFPGPVIAKTVLNVYVGPIRPL